MSFYNETLLDHSSHPLHRGEITNADVVFEAKNASCGDNIKLFLKVEDNKIIDAGFTGVGCAVSQASADNPSRCPRHTPGRPSVPAAA